MWSAGLHRSDPRLRECFFHLRKLQDTEGTVDRTAFHRSVWICPPRGCGCGCGLLNAVVVSCCRCVAGFVSFILKALQGRFVIPDFSTFTEETQKLFSRCRQFSPAQVSTSCFSLVDTVTVQTGPGPAQVGSELTLKWSPYFTFDLYSSDSDQSGQRQAECGQQQVGGLHLHRGRTEVCTC